MYQVKVTIEGLVPTMFNRFFNVGDTEGRAKKKSKTSWKEELPLRMYLDKQSVAYIPADNIRMTLIGNKLRPGAAKILGSFMEKSKGSQYRQFCESCVWVRGMADPEKVYFEPPRQTYDDFDERSFIDAKGTRQLTRRPLIKTPWRLQFIVEVTDDQMDEGKLKEFFVVAGLRCGIGTYGPKFGRFEVTQWKLLPEKKRHK